MDPDRDFVRSRQMAHARSRGGWTGQPGSGWPSISSRPPASPTRRHSPGTARDSSPETRRIRRSWWTGSPSVTRCSGAPRGTAATRVCDLGVPDGFLTSSANDVNAFGFVVGTARGRSATGSLVSAAFVWRPVGPPPELPIRSDPTGVRPGSARRSRHRRSTSAVTWSLGPTAALRRFSRALLWRRHRTPATPIPRSCRCRRASPTPSPARSTHAGISSARRRSALPPGR